MAQLSSAIQTNPKKTSTKYNSVVKGNYLSHLSYTIKAYDLTATF